MGAFVALRRWARTPWPYLTLALACSPVAWFSVSMAAPNGLEIAAAAGLWALLMGLFRPDRTRADALLLGIGTVSACLLVTVRSLGPLWAVLILGAVVAATSERRAVLGRLLSDRRVQVGAAIVAVVTVASLAWIMSTGSLVIGKFRSPHALDVRARQHVGEVAGPMGVPEHRGVPVPEHAGAPAVYVAYLLLVTWLMIFGLRAADRAGRRAMVGVMVVALALPLGLTIATLDDFGFSWQGRYTLPFDGVRPPRRRSTRSARPRTAHPRRRPRRGVLRHRPSDEPRQRRGRRTPAEPGGGERAVAPGRPVGPGCGRCPRHDRPVVRHCHDRSSQGPGWGGSA